MSVDGEGERRSGSRGIERVDDLDGKDLVLGWSGHGELFRDAVVLGLDCGGVVTLGGERG